MILSASHESPSPSPLIIICHATCTRRHHNLQFRQDGNTDNWLFITFLSTGFSLDSVTVARLPTLRHYHTSTLPQLQIRLNRYWMSGCLCWALAYRNVDCRESGLLLNALADPVFMCCPSHFRNPFSACVYFVHWRSYDDDGRHNEYR